MKLNMWGIPIWTKSERKIIHEILVSQQCKVCRAKKGYQCVIGRYISNDEPTDFSNRKRRMEPGKVHMGRLPNGFDSVEAVKAAKKAKK